MQTAARRCSYAELLLSEGDRRDNAGVPAVGTATHFVSHAWRYPRSGQCCFGYMAPESL